MGLGRCQREPPLESPEVQAKAVRKGAHLKQSPTSDKGPGTGSLVPFTNRSPHNRTPSRGPAIPAGASSSRDVPMEEGRQGTEFHEGSGVRLYQQNISVGLDPREVMSQAREFESAVIGQAKAAVQETRNQVRDEAMQFGASLVHQAQSQVHEAQAIAKAAAAAAVEQARVELRLEVQQRELLFQQKESDLMAQIRALQSEVTILRGLKFRTCVVQ